VPSASATVPIASGGATVSSNRPRAATGSS
jgi:hypothetical protein